MRTYKQVFSELAGQKRAALIPFFVVGDPDFDTSLEVIRKVKEHRDIPIGLLMYYNLIYQYGTEKFFSDFHNAGVNSVLVADLSIDDAEEITGPAESAGLDTVFMVTPITYPERMNLI